MTLAMTRLPPDSFLPSGGMPLDTREERINFGNLGYQPSSIISPLSLPGAANQLSYFDEASLAKLPPPSYSHLQSSAAAWQTQRYLSPHRSPPNAQNIRSSSRSPTRHQQSQRSVTSPLATPTSHPTTSTSPEQISHQSAILQLRRVTIQNRRLLENWEAERAHLEANRARAEEIYKEEREIMDEERLIWAKNEAVWMDEKRQYLEEIRRLQDRVRQLEMQVTGGTYSPAMTSHGLRHSGPVASSHARGKDSMVAPPSLTARATSDSTSSGSRTGPLSERTMPESHPFIPLDPRMQSASPVVGSPCQGPERIPAIDIQVIHPELEGIPIRSTAVQKPTFTDDGSQPSPGSKRPSPTETGSPNNRPAKLSPERRTMDVLTAPEDHRLTMHAGHTPNHSLSQFPTAPSTNAVNTAGSSGASTPTRGFEQHSLHNLDGTASSAPAIASASESSTSRENGTSDTAPTERDLEDPEPLLEPSEDDRPLAGPLTLRNQPAHDERILRSVSSRLQDSLERDGATPTVLLNDPLESAAGPAHEPTVNHGGDATSDSCPDDEPDVPLRLKQTSNFGAPLGER